ncbi:hypothetical protein [Clostridium perfringens]|uniref:hypothetical protein n=1 Tax=Clostridium perfringens TaxID=1502 RepID=UPI00297178CD|nr:hypothetical protein [Clostridium perfringens]MDM0581938.1 hypothetical protein [Clostridium perfringens]MDM0588295.1 hypothetical protein [Clostridium perfringens]MDM0594368.1 hypothetical protein [Clostridium perfringens]MDM0597416.1 hypothetical protein [Clostridium perfringens]
MEKKLILVKRIPIKIPISEFLITFSYETRKGYYREQQRTLKHFTEEEAIFCFKVWAKNQRTMFNVKILSIVENENKETIEL